MKILISGGGIGGLCAALCLAQSGHSVTIFEQATAFTEVGAGLQVSPNAMKVLRALGLEAEARAAAFEPEQIEMRFGISGQTIFSIPLKGYAEKRWGAPFLQFHRAELLGVLADAAMQCPDIAIEMSAKVSCYEQTGDGVQVYLTDGSVFSGELLVGADGLHSQVRDQMLGPEKPAFTGCVAWRGIVPFEALMRHPPPPTACAWVGRGKHAVTYRVSGGRMVNFVGVVEQPEFIGESWSQKGTKAQIAKDFSSWHPVIEEIVNAGEAFFRWGLFGRPALPHWHDGRVVILGDAAHPMLPFLAQGAVMAIEDGWVLAACLNDEDVSLSERLTAYQARRLPRCSAVQAASKRNQTIFHLENPITRAGVYGPMKLGALIAPGRVHARMDWIYGHDVTQATG